MSENVDKSSQINKIFSWNLKSFYQNPLIHFGCRRISKYFRLNATAKSSRCVWILRQILDFVAVVGEVTVFVASINQLQLNDFGLDLILNYGNKNRYTKIMK